MFKNRKTIDDDLSALNWLTYDSGHLHGIELGNKTLLDFERDKLHREVQRSFAGLNVQKSYDPLSRLKYIQAQTQNPIIGGAVNRRYHYDSTGQITQLDVIECLVRNLRELPYLLLWGNMRGRSNRRLRHG